MEKLVREELERWDSDASLRSGNESRTQSAASAGGASRAGSRVPTARSMYSQGGKSAASRGRKTVEGSAASLRMQPVRFFHNISIFMALLHDAIFPAICLATVDLKHNK